MFKKSIYLVSIFALFTGCVEKNPEITTYDLSNYWFNMKSLNDNKTVLSKSFIEQYDNGVKSDEYKDFTVYKKSKTLKYLFREKCQAKYRQRITFRYTI